MDLLQELKDLIAKFENPVAPEQPVEEPVAEVQPEASTEPSVESPVEPQPAEGEQVTQ